MLVSFKYLSSIDLNNVNSTIPAMCRVLRLTNNRRAVYCLEESIQKFTEVHRHKHLVMTLYHLIYLKNIFNPKLKFSNYSATFYRFTVMFWKKLSKTYTPWIVDASCACFAIVTARVLNVALSSRLQRGDVYLRYINVNHHYACSLR